MPRYRRQERSEYTNIIDSLLPFLWNGISRYMAGAKTHVPFGLPGCGGPNELLSISFQDLAGPTSVVMHSNGLVGALRTEGIGCTFSVGRKEKNTENLCCQ